MRRGQMPAAMRRSFVGVLAKMNGERGALEPLWEFQIVRRGINRIGSQDEKGANLATIESAAQLAEIAGRPRVRIGTDGTEPFGGRVAKPLVQNRGPILNIGVAFR